MKFAYTFCIALIGTVMVSCTNSETPKPNPDKRKSFEDVIDYNNYIVDQIDAVQIAHDNALNPNITLEEALKACDSLVVKCEKGEENIKGIQPFAGDSSLSMQMLEYLRFMKSTGVKGLREFLQLEDKYMSMTDQESPEGESLSKSLDEMIAKQNAIRSEELAKVDKVHIKFGKRHRMNMPKIDRN